MTLLDATIIFVMERPRLAAALSGLSLVDMSNCIAHRHSDWWFPAVVAFGLACLVRRRAAS